MESKTVLIVGLAVALIGGLLVSVEAIKLENIRRFYELLHYKVDIGLQSPLFEPPPGEEVPPVWNVNGRGFGGRHRLYGWAHWAIGFAVLGSIELIVLASADFNLIYQLFHAINLTWLWLSIILWILAIYFLVVGVWITGELIIHQVLLRSVRALTKALVAIDENTPSGAIGIIGAALLVVGFAIQVVGTIIA